jgi:hypothetical protein
MNYEDDIVWSGEMDHREKDYFQGVIRRSDKLRLIVAPPRPATSTAPKRQLCTKEQGVRLNACHSRRRPAARIVGEGSCMGLSA